MEFTKKPLFDERNLFQKNPEYPRITIITPSYNQAEFLERTILSILNQNYPNLEYIIIDGGSTDGSVEIIKKYEKYLTYWISEKDNGQVDAINKGFKIATGELVAWQNADDFYLPNAFYTLANLVKENPNYGLYFGNIYLVNSNDEIIREMRFHPFSVNHLIYCSWNLSSQAVFWRKSIFDKVGYLLGYNVLFDWEWFIRLGKKGFRFLFIHSFMGAYRIHEFSKLSLVKNRCGFRKKILQKYGIKYRSESDFENEHRLVRMYFQCNRIFHYFIQKDFSYLCFLVTSKWERLRT